MDREPRCRQRRRRGLSVTASAERGGIKKGVSSQEVGGRRKELKIDGRSQEVEERS